MKVDERYEVKLVIVSGEGETYEDLQEFRRRFPKNKWRWGYAPVDIETGETAIDCEKVYDSPDEAVEAIEWNCYLPFN
jgi:hypothetical protein